MTGTDPLIAQVEEPQEPVLEVPRSAFGLREVMILTVVVMMAATLLVVLLYLSPLATR